MRTSGSFSSKNPPEVKEGDTQTMGPDTSGTRSLSVRGATVPWVVTRSWTVSGVTSMTRTSRASASGELVSTSGRVTTRATAPSRPVTTIAMGSRSLRRRFMVRSIETGIELARHWPRPQLGPLDPEIGLR